MSNVNTRPVECASAHIATPHCGQSESAASVLPPTLASCGGAPSHIQPWRPHPVCVHCARRTHIGVSVIRPALVRSNGTFGCANKVAE